MILPSETTYNIFWCLYRWIVIVCSQLITFVSKQYNYCGYIRWQLSFEMCTIIVSPDKERNKSIINIFQFKYYDIQPKLLDGSPWIYYTLGGGINCLIIRRYLWRLCIFCLCYRYYIMFSKGFDRLQLITLYIAEMEYMERLIHCHKIMKWIFCT